MSIGCLGPWSRLQKAPLGLVLLMACMAASEFVSYTSKSLCFVIQKARTTKLVQKILFIAIFKTKYLAPTSKQPYLNQAPQSTYVFVFGNLLALAVHNSLCAGSHLIGCSLPFQV